jgi:flagellar basal-body rod protein FlgG
MFKPLYVASTGLNAFDTEMIDITNNLANAKTTGFKRGRVDFETIYAQAILSASQRINNDQTKPVTSELGSGVKVAGTPKDFSQGTVEVTKSPLDIAIQGDGFLQFRLPDGTVAYSRAGNFQQDSSGNLISPSGYPLEPNITLPQGTTDILIDASGKFFVQVNNQLEQIEVGQLSLARFINPQGLESRGENLYVKSNASGEPIIGLPGEEGFGGIAQFSLETSNVDVVEELMRMIITQRVFDTVTKAVQSYEAMLTSVGQMKG